METAEGGPADRGVGPASRGPCEKTIKRMEAEGSECVCVTPQEPQGTAAMGTARGVLQQIPSLLRDWAPFQLFSGARHRPAMGTSSAPGARWLPHSGSLSTATRSLRPLCRTCHQWERRNKLGGGHPKPFPAVPRLQAHVPQDGTEGVSISCPGPAGHVRSPLLSRCLAGWVPWPPR